MLNRAEWRRSVCNADTRTCPGRHLSGMLFLPHIAKTSRQRCPAHLLNVNPALSDAIGKICVQDCQSVAERQE